MMLSQMYNSALGRKSNERDISDTWNNWLATKRVCYAMFGLAYVGLACLFLYYCILWLSILCFIRVITCGIEVYITHTVIELSDGHVTSETLGKKPSFIMDAILFGVGTLVVTLCGKVMYNVIISRCFWLR